MDFYDAVAEHYSEIVNEANRTQGVERFAKELAERVDGGRALDLACGAGLYSIALAKAGMSVTGVDLSADMLGLAAAKATQAGVDITLHEAAMQNLPGELVGPFDLAVCMGNSVPHLLSEADLAAFLDGVKIRLVAGGQLAIHLLNYNRILAEQERVVGVTRSEDGQYTFVRFYDFLENTVRFNILQLQWDGEGNDAFDLQSTELRPWRDDELLNAMKEAGFTEVQAFGGLDCQAFAPERSDTLLLQARRPA